MLRHRVNVLQCCVTPHSLHEKSQTIIELALDGERLEVGHAGQLKQELVG